MKRVVYLPSIGRSIGLAECVRAVRTAKANPDAWFPQTFESWAGGTGREVMAEYRESLHERISDGVPYCLRGTEEGEHLRLYKLYSAGRGDRKWAPEYQTCLRRDCYSVRNMARRIRVYQFETPEMRARFGHRLARYDD